MQKRKLALKIDYHLLIDVDNRNTFNNEFIEKQIIFFTIFNKIYNKSGIEGTKANSIIYCPNKNIYLICTLKGLPTKIKH